MPLCYRVPSTSSITILQTSVFTFIKSLVQYLSRGTGLFLSPVTEYTYFLRSDRYPPGPPSKEEEDSSRPENLPDLEFGWISAWGTTEEAVPEVDKRYGFNTLLVQAPRPESTGRVILRSLDARLPMAVDPNYLSDERDLQILRKGVEFGMDIGEKMIAIGYGMTKALAPENTQTKTIDDFIRKYVTGAYHLSSTCRMCAREEGGVVDQELRVYGIQGLRVADASIFPRIVTVKPQATIVLVAEKCAELILNDN